MGSSSTLVVIVTVVFGILPTCIMQGYGTFNDHWVSNSTCDYIGLSSACCINSTTHNSHSSCIQGDSDVPGFAAFFNYAAAVIMLSAVIGTIGGVCWCESDDDDEDSWWPLFGCVLACAGFLGTIFYPVAGVLSFVGCMLLVPGYSGHGYTFGTPFILCTTSGLIVMVMCALLLFFGCREKTKENISTIASSHSKGTIFWTYNITTVVIAIYGGIDDD